MKEKDLVWEEIKTEGKEYVSKESAESALDCAKRELMEETGYISR